MPLFASDSFFPDTLLAGSDGSYVALPVNILTGEGALARGSVLGVITDGGENDGKYKLVDSTETDGSQNPVCVLCEEVEVPEDADQVSSAWFAGEFNENELSFGGTDTVETHRAALIARGIYPKGSVSDGNP